MPGKQNVKKAAKKIKSTNKTTQKKRPCLIKRTFHHIWRGLCTAGRTIKEFFVRVWGWICKLNFVALLNCTLLVAIIVLFSMLIMDILGCKKTVIVIADQKPAIEQVVITEKSAPESIVLPLKGKSNKAINIVPLKKSEVQTAKQNKTLMGDVIIDSRASGAVLQDNSTISGNLYLQNMRKYTLPCDIKINGNLFLRDVNLLQFCGDFTVTGNIYVSPRSSFGPIPKTARVGGYVVL